MMRPRILVIVLEVGTSGRTRLILSRLPTVKHLDVRIRLMGPLCGAHSSITRLSSVQSAWSADVCNCEPTLREAVILLDLMG